MARGFLHRLVTLGSGNDGFSIHIVRSECSESEPGSFPAVQMDTIHLLACPAGYKAQSILRPQQCCWMSFEVTFDRPMGPLFLAELCKPLMISLKNADPSLVQAVLLIANEMQASRCGQSFFINRAGDILLIGLMRHLTSQPQQKTGLFRGLSDPRIARSLVALHTDAAHPWTLEMLANLAGMSRTSFANHFKNVMQVAPEKYLGNLRLAIARQLAQTGIGLKQIAARTGYASPSTLSRALGRTLGGS